MKRGVRTILIIVALFLISFVSAAAIEDTLHVNIQAIDGTGAVVTGSYNFTFNISKTEACDEVIYSNRSYLTTDSRGIISYYLENVNLNYSEQYWLCYYRNFVLINASKISRTPYTVRAKNMSAEGIINDSNMDMTGKNITASTGFFSWLGDMSSKITKLFVQDIDFTGSINGSGNINTTGNITALNVSVIGNLSVENNVFAKWFYGLFNWIIKDDLSRKYLTFNGSDLNFSETALNASIDARTVSITYYPSDIDTIVGTNTGGNLVSATYRDGIYYNVSEVAGTPGWRVDVNFTGIVNFDSILLMEYYNGGVLGHDVLVQLYDWTGADWEDYYTITNQEGQVSSFIPVYDPVSHISGTGEVSVRFYHVQAGVTTHRFYLDMINLQDGFTSLTNAEHDSLSGRDSVLNHPWALDRNGTKELTNNWEVGGWNITNISQVGIGTNEPTHTLNVVGTMNVTGVSYLNDTEFNNGWLNNGVSILDGSIYAQILYVYNITALNINNLVSNGSIFPAFDNIYALGNSTHRWTYLHLSKGANISGTVYLNGQNLTQEIENLNATNYWNRSGTNLFPRYIGDNVGIGTTNPFVKFQVDDTNGRMFFDGSAAASNNFVLQNTAAGGRQYSLRTTNTGLLHIRDDTAGAERVTVNGSSGNVGIGTATPQTKLELYNSSATNQELLRLTNPDGGGAGTKIAFYQSEEVGNITSMWGGSYWQLRLGTQNNGNTIVLNNGNVGIGTTSPTIKLTIDGSGLTNGILLKDTTANYGFLGTHAAWTGAGTSTNLTLATYSPRDLILGTSGVDRLHIASAGNVGIGTTSPSYKLDVYDASGNVFRGGANGDFIFALAGQAIAGTQLFSIRNDGAPRVYVNTQNNASLVFGTSPGISAGSIDTDMVINGSTGYVGIGTVSPNYQLTVSSASGGKILVGGALGSAIGFNDMGTNISIPAANTLTFATSGTEKVRIDNNGNVGIGTSSPTNPLSLGGADDAILTISADTADGTDNNLIRLAGGGTGGVTRGAYIDLNGNERTGGVGNLDILAGAPLGNITFNTNNANVMRITAGGNVGVGTTTPVTNLQVAGQNLSVGGAGITSPQIIMYYDFTVDKSNNLIITAGNPTKSISVGNYGHLNLTSGGGKGMVIMDTTGYVGIGTGGPEQKLHIAGNVKLGNNNSGNYISYVTDSNRQIIVTNRSDGTQGGMLSSNGWGDFVFNKAVGVGYDLSGAGQGAGNLLVSGNVGIGTTSPADKLEVDGTNSRFLVNTQFGGGIMLNDTRAVDRDWAIQVSETQYQGTGVAGTFNFINVGNGSVMTLTAGGNVGIGTTSPGTKLHTYVDGADNILKVETATSGSAKLWLQNTGAGNFYLISNRTTTSTQFVNPFANNFEWWANGAEIMRLTSGGNVGIGTTSPVAQLNVKGVGQTTAAITDAGAVGGTLFLNDAGGNVGNGGAILFGGLAANVKWFAAIKGLIQDGAGNTAGDLAFSTRLATADIALTERMRITQAGNVGIGTASPTYKLEVAGGGTAGLLVASSQTPVVNITAQGVGYGGRPLSVYSGRNTVGGLLINAGDAYNPNVLWVYDNGVGINTTTPTKMLSVNGGASFGTYGYTQLGYENQSSGFANLGTDNAGSTLLSNNLYTTGGSLYVANAHATISGTAIKIPGNALTRQGNIEFWTTPPAAVATGSLYAQANPRMVIDTTGNVGIGTTSPSENLDVNANISVKQSSSAGTLGGYYWNVGGTRTGYIRQVGDGGATYDIRFGTYYAGGLQNDLMTIKQGNVGIGTTTPSALLNLYKGEYGTSRMFNVYNTGNNGGVNDTAFIHSDQPFLGGTGATIYNGTVLRVTAFPYDVANNNGSVLAVGTGDGNGNSFTPYLVVRSRDGKVGIGTVIPYSKLSVSGSSAGEVGINVNNTNTAGYSAIRLGGAGKSDTAGVLNIHALGSTYASAGPYYASGANIDGAGIGGLTFSAGNAKGNLSFFTGGYAAGNERMRITSAGNVGIGTTSPDDKLVVAGNIGVGGASFTTPGGTSGQGIAFPSTANDIVRIYGEHDGADTSNLIIFTADNQGDGVKFRNSDCCGGGILDYLTISRSGGISYTGSGNVGIGAVATTKLEVSGEAARTQVDVLNTANGGFRVVATTPATDPYANFLLQGVTTTPYLEIQAGDTGQYRTVALNPLGGNVGIGTTSPLRLLQVGAGIPSSVDTANLRLATLTGSTVANTKGVVVYTYVPETASYGTIEAYNYTSVAGLPLVINPSGGNVGIGTTAPLSKLSINGGLHVGGDSDAGDNNLLVDGVVSAPYYDLTAGDGYGIRFWGSDNYKIHMGNLAEYHYGPVTGYSIKTSMSNDGGRGWTWGGAGIAPIAAIEVTTGNMQIAGTMTATGFSGPLTGTATNANACSGDATCETNALSATTIDGSGDLTVASITMGAGNIVTTGNLSVDGIDFARKTDDALQINTVLKGGLYTNSGDGLLNAAGGATALDGWWHVINMHHTDNNGFNAQIAMPLSSTLSDMYLRTSSGGAWTEWRKVLSENTAGKVGIGTTTPAYLLEIANSATALNVSGFLYANSSDVIIGSTMPGGGGVTPLLSVDSASSLIKDPLITIKNITSWKAVIGATSSGGSGHMALYGTNGVTSISFTETNSYLRDSKLGIGIAAPTYMLEINQSATAMNVSGLLYANSSSVGIGTSNPITQLNVPGYSSPVNASSVATGTNPTSVYVQGRYAYILNYGGDSFKIIDVSNPSSPVSVSSIATGNGPYNVHVQGRYAYFSNYIGNNLQIIDVSNPSSPVNVSSIATGLNPTGVYVQGRYAYVPNSGGDNLQIIDVSNPYSPVNVSGVATGNGPYRAYVQGRYAYVPNNVGDNLQIIDVSNPSSPVNVSSIATGDVPYNVYVQGRYAYVSNYNGNNLQIIDVSNPSSPVNVSGVATGVSPFSAYVQGRYAYVPNYNGDNLQIIDVSNPSSPVNVSSVATGNSPYFVYVQGRYAYVSNYIGNNLQIIDLGGAYIQSLETGGIETGTLATRSNAQIGNDLDVKGGLSVGATANFMNTLSVFSGFGGNSSFIVNPNGNVGIGVGTPQKALHINGASTYNDFILQSVANSAEWHTVGEALGAYHISLAVASNAFYTYYTDETNVARFINTVGSALDLAEWYKVGSSNLDDNGNSTLLKGNILCADSDERTKVVACTSAYDQKILGIVSTMSYTSMGMNEADDDHHDAVELALAGQVPTIVTIKDNTISNGDLITSSDISGVGMKATQAGFVAGKALESTKNWSEKTCSLVSSLDEIKWMKAYDQKDTSRVNMSKDDGTNSGNPYPCYRLSDGTYFGKIMVLVNPQWWGMNANLNLSFSNIDANLIPQTNLLNLGNASNTWNNIYGKNLLQETTEFNDLGVYQYASAGGETKKYLNIGNSTIVALNEITKLKDENKKMKESLCKLGAEEWC